MSSNLDKSTHGSNGQISLEALIESLKDNNYIANYWTKVSKGYPGLQNQFYFQFVIKFYDGSRWILQSTTSIRDRINIQQWHSEHFKRIDSTIERAYVIYPDTMSNNELNLAIAYNNKIAEEKIYSAIDGVVSQSEIYFLIEEKALQDSNAGSAKAKKGLNFENHVAEVLNNKSNFIKWKNNDKLATGLFYGLFKKIVDRLGINPSNVIEVNATADSKIIGTLPSRGKPKTDIIFKVKFNDNRCINFNFSCKRSSKSWVSVHQYSAKSFIEVLGIQDPDLQKALLAFQEAGSLSAFGEKNGKYLTQALKPFIGRLELWVYGGIDGYGNPDTQWANFMITYKNDTGECDIFTIYEYIDILTQNGVEGHFGTLFTWSYASGERGKSIQLKSKVL